MCGVAFDIQGEFNWCLVFRSQELGVHAVLGVRSLRFGLILCFFKMCVLAIFDFQSFWMIGKSFGTFLIDELLSCVAFGHIHNIHGPNFKKRAFGASEDLKYKTLNLTQPVVSIHGTATTTNLDRHSSQMCARHRGWVFMLGNPNPVQLTGL